MLPFFHLCKSTFCELLQHLASEPVLWSAQYVQTMLKTISLGCYSSLWAPSIVLALRDWSVLPAVIHHWCISFSRMVRFGPVPLMGSRHEPCGSASSLLPSLIFHHWMIRDFCFVDKHSALLLHVWTTFIYTACIPCKPISQVLEPATQVVFLAGILVNHLLLQTRSHFSFRGRGCTVRQCTVWVGLLYDSVRHCTHSLHGSIS